MRKLALAARISTLAVGAAIAQTAPPTTTPPPATKAPATKAPSTRSTVTTHTPESIECSRQADAKGLHGKERRKFRSACKRDLLKKKA